MQRRTKLKLCHALIARLPGPVRYWPWVRPALGAEDDTFCWIGIRRYGQVYNRTLGCKRCQRFDGVAVPPPFRIRFVPHLGTNGYYDVVSVRNPKVSYCLQVSTEIQCPMCLERYWNWMRQRYPSSWY